MKRRIFSSWLSKLFDAVESQAHYKLANDLMQQGDLTAAIASYNTAIKLKPDLLDAYKNLAMHSCRRETTLEQLILIKQLLN